MSDPAASTNVTLDATLVEEKVSILLVNLSKIIPFLFAKSLLQLFHNILERDPVLSSALEVLDEVSISTVGEYVGQDGSQVLVLIVSAATVARFHGTVARPMNATLAWFILVCALQVDKTLRNFFGCDVC